MTSSDSNENGFWEYGLYQTLKTNIPSKDLTSHQKDQLLQRLSNLTYQQKEAVFLLICEHAKQNVEGASKTENNYTIPYEGRQKDNDIILDMDKLPISLRWILYKFTDIINKT